MFLNQSCEPPFKWYAKYSTCIFLGSRHSLDSQRLRATYLSKIFLSHPSTHLHTVSLLSSPEDTITYMAPEDSPHWREPYLCINPKSILRLAVTP